MIKKVVRKSTNETVLDLTKITAQASDISSGVTAHDSNGESIIGTNTGKLPSMDYNVVNKIYLDTYKEVSVDGNPSTWRYSGTLSTDYALGGVTVGNTSQSIYWVPIQDFGGEPYIILQDPTSKEILPGSIEQKVGEVVESLESDFTKGVVGGKLTYNADGKLTINPGSKLYAKGGTEAGSFGIVFKLEDKYYVPGLFDTANLSRNYTGVRNGYGESGTMFNGLSLNETLYTYAETHFIKPVEKFSQLAILCIKLTTTNYSGQNMNYGLFRMTYNNLYEYYGVLEETAKTTPISFTIENTAYQAEEGMTWAQWVESSYNTSGFVIEDNEVKFVSGGSNWVQTSNGYGVVPTDTIIADHAYGRNYSSGEID